ncbi:MAG: PocR ligand-binding domain-containing protein [Clostridia bacterium]|nr:PocR ligand-binding domain-containing protein [Clostridia bacterium]
MPLKFERSQLEALMRSFYMLSGIRFVLFDSDFHEIMAYPKTSCDFCSIMKSCGKTRRRCNYADRRSFMECEKQNSLIIYKCHAGLVEAVMPLHENEKIIGYLMFGQITDNPDKSSLYDRISFWEEKYDLSPEALKKGIDLLPSKTDEEIRAAAKIMEACTSYIIYKELITPENDKLFETAKSYIEEHLKEDISIEDLCAHLGIGRTKLYEIFRSELKMGISKYLLKRRLHRAKTLLKTTEDSVAEIAEAVGFSDYNYFSRVYKNTYGKSPRHYRK